MSKGFVHAPVVDFTRLLPMAVGKLAAKLGLAESRFGIRFARVVPHGLLFEVVIDDEPLTAAQSEALGELIMSGAELAVLS